MNTYDEQTVDELMDAAQEALLSGLSQAETASALASRYSIELEDAATIVERTARHPITKILLASR